MCRQSGQPDGVKVTREFLLAHVFKKSATIPDFYVLEHVRLADISRDLGFPLAALRMSMSGPETRCAQVGGFYFKVRSEVRDNEWALNDPQTICTVSVSLNPRSGAKYVRTDSLPRMRIKSVTLPQDRSKALEVTFELAADGKTPLVVSQGQFLVAYATQGRSPQDSPALDVWFLKKTPARIAVEPGKPVVLTAGTSTGDPVTGRPWSELPSGEYVLCVGIASGAPEDAGFDYHWIGTKFSDDYTFVVK